MIRCNNYFVKTWSPFPLNHLSCTMVNTKNNSEFVLTQVFSWSMCDAVRIYTLRRTCKFKGSALFLALMCVLIWKLSLYWNTILFMLLVKFVSGLPWRLYCIDQLMTESSVTVTSDIATLAYIVLFHSY